MNTVVFTFHFDAVWCQALLAVTFRHWTSWISPVSQAIICCELFSLPVSHGGQLFR